MRCSDGPGAVLGGALGAAAQAIWRDTPAVQVRLLQAMAMLVNRSEPARKVAIDIGLC